MKSSQFDPGYGVRGYFEIKRLKTRGLRQPGNSVCIKTPVFLKIPKTENTKIPGFQALYLQIASKCNRIADLVKIGDPLEFLQSLLMLQCEMDSFASFFSPGGDIEDGRLEGLLSFAFGFAEQVSGIGFSVGSFGRVKTPENLNPVAATQPACIIVMGRANR